ncbi:MAG: GAF domain-containing protein [Mariprofundus sp.]|nr:GAF domain-containing protein [Mariprofundus sp.]
MAMSEKPDVADMLASLLSSVRELTGADGATAYLLDSKNRLYFFVIQNSSLNLFSEKTPEILDRLKNIPLFAASGQINEGSVAAVAAAKNKSINISDIYSSEEFNSLGAKNFDEKMHYKTKSMLVVPMSNQQQEVVGVLQLINHIDSRSGQADAFTSSDVCIVEILAKQAAIHVENHGVQRQNNTLMDHMTRISKIGVALSSEHNIERLLEYILDHAKELTGADGGTLYLYEDGKLNFEVMRTDSLNIHVSNAEGNLANLQPIEMYAKNGQSNDHIVAANAAVYERTINIPNVYSNKEFNFTKVKSFDRKNGYCTRSMLTVPLINQQAELVGVLQLINATDLATNEIEDFSALSQELSETLASLAAVAITNNRLTNELQVLIESFIEVISKAIDEKSAYTGGHCRRVPELSLLLAHAVSDHDSGELANFKLTAETMYEMKIAAMLHDCGKITTPVHIVDKATKLEKIFDRIELIALRYEILRRDEVIQYLKGQSGLSDEIIHAAIQHQWAELAKEVAFLRSSNAGGEFMAPDRQERVRSIAKTRGWTDAEGKVYPILNKDEVYNLNIAKGTLNKEDRDIINYHIIATINMLEALPFPKHLRNVAEIAGGHHERMDGKGYPKGLTRDQMSVQARVMGIADIFEALTACDRPYRKAMPLSQAMSIMEKMKEEGHIDPELFEIFKQHRIHIHYGRKYLHEDQMDIE